MDCRVKPGNDDEVRSGVALDRRALPMNNAAMHLDVVDLRDFYASPVGQMVARHLSPVVKCACPQRRRHARARLRLSPRPTSARSTTAERVLAFMPAGQGVIDWPPGSGSAGSATALVEEDSLPLPDSSIDLVILVHALEMSDRPNALMAELRRVLTSGGRLIVVVPNRQGPWASTDLSPFGFGRPYSRGQLRQPLRRGRLRGGDVDDGAPHGAGLLAAAARRGARARPDRAARLAGLRRRDRGLGGEAHRAGRSRSGRGRGSARRSARRSDRRRARSGAHRRESRKIAWSARKFHSGRRTERFRTRPLP